MLTESSLNPKALSSENAKGLMQMTPIAVKEVQNQNPWLPNDPDLYDPETNILYGVLLLEHYQKQTNGIEELLANFNGGIRQVNRLRAGAPLADETSLYLPRVLLRRDCLNRPDRLRLPYEDIAERVLKSREGLFVRSSRQDFQRQPSSLYVHGPRRYQPGRTDCTKSSNWASKAEPKAISNPIRYNRRTYVHESQRTGIFIRAERLTH